MNLLPRSHASFQYTKAASTHSFAGTDRTCEVSLTRDPLLVLRSVLWRPSDCHWALKFNGLPFSPLALMNSTVTVFGFCGADLSSQLLQAWLLPRSPEGPGCFQSFRAAAIATVLSCGLGRVIQCLQFGMWPSRAAAFARSWI